MTTYKSNSKLVNKSNSAVFAQLNNLKNIELLHGNIAESMQIKNLTISDNDISFEIDMAGKISLQIVKSVPDKFVQYQLKSIIKDADLQININEVASEQSEIILLLTVDLPVMIKMMLGSKLDDGINNIAEAIAKAFNNQNN